MITKYCLNCSAEYAVKPYRKNTAYTCSDKCRQILDKNKINDIFNYIDIKNEDECWLYTRGKSAFGYGRFTMAGEHWYAHKLVYCIFVNGPIHPDIKILHSCDNPPCCNPFHLFSGTNKDNTQDMLKKGRGNRAKGEKHWNAKLSEKEVEEILLLKDIKLQREVAEQFFISRQTVGLIWTRRIWTDVSAGV